MLPDRLARIRKIIEEAKPAEEFFAEQVKLERANPANTNKADFYQTHLDALTKEYNAIFGDECLNQNEAMSVRALVAYVAFTHDISEQVVCSIVEKHFCVEEIRKISRKDYDDAIKYLVDLEPGKAMN